MKYASILIAAVLAAGQVKAAEYFVSSQGSDASDGLSKNKAFLTIQKGLDALKTGDTLTIAPGEYFEHVKRDNLGGPDAETIIRAEIPGTVLLRGDVKAPEFEKVKGYRFVYAAGFDREPQAVNEVDTLTIMETAPSVAELEFAPGGCFYDIAKKTLYISTTDLQPPDQHHYTVSVTKNYGLYINQPVRVVIEGLAFTGFNSAGILPGSPGDFTISGLLLLGARHCVVRECAAFLNANGLVVNCGVFSRYTMRPDGIPDCGGLDKDGSDAPGSNIVERCRAYANYSRHSGSGGNIIVFNSNDDLIRDCISFGSATHGIRHYGNLRGPAVMRHIVSWGNTINDIHIKGKNAAEFGLAEHCVTLGAMHVSHVNHNILGCENRYNSDPGPDNIRYDLEAEATRDREFADPDNLDFRLQADSQFRGTGPEGSDRGAFAYATNIFYVKPEGDDMADGLCMARAWKTLGRAMKELRPGDTLYLAGGTYAAEMDLRLGREGGAPVRVRGRGEDAVLITGAVRVAESAGLTFERLSFGGAVTLAGSRQITFDNCRFTGAPVAVAAKSVTGLRITHGEFTGFEQAALDLAECSDAYLSGNIFDNRQGPALRIDKAASIIYSDYNSYRRTRPAWEVNGAAVAWESVSQRPERYSRELAPEFRLAGGLPVLENAVRFAAGGPMGMRLGNYRVFRQPAVRVSGPEVHSLTPTTASVEWMTSRPARCDVAWGDAPDCTNRLSFNADGFGSLSLTGLRPATKYYFRIAGACALSDPSSIFNHKTVTPTVAGEARCDSAPSPEFLPIVFETPASMPEPVTYYVAPDGDDARDGRSRETAFQTIARAADRANAGDTVLIATGIYKETVRVRATGLPNRPITFKSAPGARAVLDGNDKTLSKALVVSGKHHVHFDGLSFRYFSPGTRLSGLFCLYRSDAIHITRCFGDGRHGYSPSFVMAYGCSGLAVRNCAILSATYGNLYLVKCPEAVIENNALVRSLIMQCVFVNEPEEKIVFKKNIITDNVPHKVMVPLLEVACRTSLVETNNAYYFRIPADERKAFMYYDPVAYGRTVESYRLRPLDASYLAPALEQFTLPEFQQRTGNTSSMAVNPGFKATVDMKTADKDGKPVFLVDQLLGKKDLDFPDLFATDPEVVKRGIGLQPEAFKDFQFIAKP